MVTGAKTADSQSIGPNLAKKFVTWLLL